MNEVIDGEGSVHKTGLVHFYHTRQRLVRLLVLLVCYSGRR